MSNILVTGGLGTIGSPLVAELRKRGHKVVSLDIRHQPNQYAPSVKNSSLGRFGGSYYVRCDVSRFRQLEEVFFIDDFDYVYHTAAEFGRWNGEDYYEQLWRTNVIGTKNILTLQRDVGFRLIFFSSSEIYGDWQGVMEEDVPDKHPVHQLSDYAMTKWVNEMQIRNDEMQEGGPSVIVRLFNSILGDQLVPVYVDGIFKLVPVEDIYNDDRGKRIEVFGFHPDTGEMQSGWISHLFREKVTKDAYRISTKYGRKVSVTGDHSVFVCGKDRLPKAIEARKLQVGDHIAIPKKVVVPDWLISDRVEIIISDEVISSGGNRWKWRIRSNDVITALHSCKEVIQTAIKESGRYNGYSSKPWWRWTHKNKRGIPLLILTNACIGIPKSALISYGLRGKRHWIPNTIQLTNDVLWLLGFYIAEGCSYQSEKGSLVSLSSHQTYLEKVCSIIKKLGWPAGTLYPYDNTKRQSSELRINCGAVYSVLKDILKVSSLAKNAKIPSWIMSLPKSRVKHFLDGYYDGDGNKKERSENAFTINTASEILANQIVFLLARFGIVASIHQYVSNCRGKKFPFFRVYAHGIQSDILEWDRGVIHNIQSKFDNDIVWAKIRNIERFVVDDYVYDFVVPGMENFLAGNMVLCHNTYGPGEHYSPYRSVNCRFLYSALTGKPWVVHRGHKRTSTYISDTVATLANIADNFIPGEVYNIAGDTLHTIEELSDMVLTITRADPKLVTVVDPEPMTTKVKQVSVEKAKRDLGHECRVKLSNGLLKTVYWMRGVYGL